MKITIVGNSCVGLSNVILLTHNLIKKVFHERPFSRLRRWPKETPFDFKQSLDDLGISLVRMAVPKFQMSCSVRDDSCVPETYLMARKVFKANISRQSLIQKEQRIPKQNSLIKI